MLAANAFAPNVSRSLPRQPGGKTKSQPYWTRHEVASIGVAGDMFVQLHTERKPDVHGELVAHGVNLLYNKVRTPIAPKSSLDGGKGLPDKRRALRYRPLDASINPFRQTHGLQELPDLLNGCRNDSGGTDA